MNLDKYLIPTYISEELDIAIESFTIANEGFLSNIMQRIRGAKSKIEKGKQTGNQQMVQDGTTEAEEIKENLEKIKETTTEPDKKNKIQKALGIVLSVISLAFLSSQVHKIASPIIQDKMFEKAMRDYKNQLHTN